MPLKPRRQKILTVQRALIRWFRHNQRDLPWRKTKDPYRILVSEIMLQQTQVDRVVPKYRAWLRQFPTVRALARATPREVLLAWEGMGYNRRALYLKRAAEDIVTRFGGRVPTAPEDLATLPGVGKYTAAAVATFVSGIPHPLADTNVRRVILRIFAGARPPRSLLHDRNLLALVENTMPRTSVAGLAPSLWGHVLMDFGALVCRSRPRCTVCPVQKLCRAYPEILKKRAADSRQRRRSLISHRSSPIHRPLPDRIYRGHILQLVRERDPRPVLVREIGPLIRLGFSRGDRPWLTRLIARLVAEGLVSWENKKRRALSLPRA